MGRGREEWGEVGRSGERYTINHLKFLIFFFRMK